MTEFVYQVWKVDHTYTNDKYEQKQIVESDEEAVTTAEDHINKEIDRQESRIDQGEELEFKQDRWSDEIPKVKEFDVDLPVDRRDGVIYRSVIISVSGGDKVTVRSSNISYYVVKTEKQ